MRRVCGLLGVCLALAGLAGCGQKGPLYLPDKTGTVITRPGGATTPPAPESAPTPNSTTDDSSSKEEDKKPK